MKATEWLVDDDRLRGAEVFVTLLTVISGGIWIYKDGFTGEVIAQVMATLGTGLIVLITVLKKLRQQQFNDFVSAGTLGLQKLQREYSGILSGPKYAKRNQQNIDPDEDKVDERKYLFFQKEGQGRESQFMPLIPFKRAEVYIYIGYDALRIGINATSPEKESIDKMKAMIKKAIMDLAENRYPGLYEEISFEQTKKQYENICVALDFKDDKISFRQFEKIVYAIGKSAIETLKRGDRVVN